MNTLRSHAIGFISLLILAMLQSTPSFAGVVVEEVDDPDQGTVTVFHMTVTPAPEPVPALKYRLWLKPQDLKPGNSVVYYLRALPEQGIADIWKKQYQEYGDAIDDWYGGVVAIDALPLDQVRKVSRSFDTRVDEIVHPGTQCRDCDWGWDAPTLSGMETITYLLPHLQAMRIIGQALALRTRFAIAEHRYDEAIEQIRMNYRLGHDVGQELFLVSALVGISIEGYAHRTVIDLVAAPNSPNLYWALSELPTPLVDCSETMQLEMSLGMRFFPPLFNAETAEHSPDQWADLLSGGIKAFMSFDGRSQPSLENESLRGIVATGLSLAVYPAAKQRLIESGMEPVVVVEMPVGQVLLVDAAREYRRIADAQEKWWYVPFAKAMQRKSEADAALMEKSFFNFGQQIANQLLPSINAVRIAQVRQDWQKNAIITLEALRMHAAVAGKFPDKLSDIKVVPVPENPLTGEPYVYRLEDGMAVVELPFSDGIPGIAWRFEIKLANEGEPGA